ncbi:hypothetical protein KAR91_51565 [Candidatus Pacearchaeota archaeon]|nr:hypothetical protein [Candidatus Pacearchaeota archaeon]
MYGIEIEDGKKIKCPNCNSIFAIENENEILYRSITLLYCNKNDNNIQVKCKQCKNVIRISKDLSTKEHTLRVE